MQNICKNYQKIVFILTIKNRPVFISIDIKAGRHILLFFQLASCSYFDFTSSPFFGSTFIATRAQIIPMTTNTIEDV